MKSLTTILFMLLFTFTAHAGILDWIRPDPRPAPYDPGRSRANVTCSATDNGWEEHWGGHRDCSSCLAKHGNCTERCEATYYTCKAEGTDYRGYAMTMEARGDSRFYTEREAMDRCQYRYQNCRITNCSESSETVSRRSCR